jgi:uncharacterized protein involved in outer membrane biogenesis
LILFGLLTGLALTVAALLVVFDETDYRRALVWSADHFLDSELLVSGPLSVRYSDGLQLSAEAFQLAAHDGSYSLETNALNLRFQLASVFSGPLWIDDLVLGDFILKINESEDNPGGVDFSIPPVIVARAQVNSLLVEYQEASPGTLHRFSLDNLIIDDAGADGPVKVQATGVFEGHKFSLDGLLPALDKIQDTTTAKPVRLDFASEKLNVVLEGSITDPLKGEGLDLKLRASAEGVDEFLEIFGDGIPTLGKLDATAMLRGDYETPRLEDIDLRLQRGEGVGLAVTGEVADVTTGEGARLQISGQSDNPAVLSWLLFKQQDRLSSITLKAALEVKNSRYFISDLDVDAKTPEGLNLLVSGTGEVFSAGHEFRKPDAGFDIKIKAPKTSIFNMMGRRDVPDLGPVSGSAAMALGLGALGLYNTDISIGRRQGTHLSLQGDIGYIPLNEAAEVRETGLKVNITTVDLAGLGKQFGYEWPNLGRSELTGELDIKDKELRLERARLSMGKPDQPTIKANGRLTTELNKGSTIELEFDVAVTDLVAAFSDNLPGYLGRLNGNVNISDMDGSWGIEKIGFVSSNTNLYRLDISGSYDDLVNFDQGNIKISIRVDDMAALGEAIEVDLSRLGSYRADGLLLGNKGKLSYRGSTSLGNSTSKTELGGTLVDGKPHFTGKFEVPVLNLADFGLSGNGGEAAGKDAGSSNDGGRVFSREPLDISFLNSFNLELDLVIDEVISKNTRIDSVEGHVSIRDGHLSAAPLHLNFEGGQADIKLDVQDAEIPEYKISFIGADVKLGSLLAQVEKDVAISGSSDVHADLEAKGHSPHELASSLNGTLRIELENARIPQKYITLLSVDVLGWVGSKTLLKEKYTNLNCVVMSFDSSDGMVTSGAFIADGPKLNIGGRIDLNLGEETLDIVLVPKEKKRIFSSISPVKITGPMSNPHVEAIPAKAAIQEIGTMALLPGVFIPVIVLEKFWGFFDEADKPGEGCKKLHQVTDAAVKEVKKETE